MVFLTSEAVLGSQVFCLLAMGKKEAMAKLSKPEEGYALMKRKVGILKGYLSEKAAEEWSDDPCTACTSNGLFLEHWLQLEHTKPETRAAIKEAFPGLQPAKAKKFLEGIGEARNFLKKKWSNLKTGDKTPPALMALMQHLFGDEPNTESLRHLASGPSKSNASKSDLESQAGSKEGSCEPEKAKAVQAAKARASHEPEKAKGKCGLLIAFQEDNQSVVSVSSTQEISQQQLLEAAKGGKATRKRPASAQRENASSPKKKPAAKPAKAEMPRQASSWTASASFGFLKATYATEKAYIVSKPDMASKASCLVNIAIHKGERQKCIVEKIMAYAVKEGLKKEQVVAFKNVALEKAEA